MRTLTIAVLSAVISFFTACTSIPENSDAPSEREGLSKEQVLEIARNAVAENDAWLDKAEFEAPKRNSQQSGWSVMVWRIPKVPGGHRLIRIDDTGNVVSYHRGR